MPATPAPDSPLARLAALAEEAGAEALAPEARALAARVHEGRFFVACVGQFKRGKSTLLNALVGDSVLPTGVTPVTAVVTVLRHGAVRAARVRHATGEWQPIDPATLSAYVSEQENPENAKQVAAVEVFVPSPLLAGGMCLVDTPGLGSVFAGNTEATRAFVPQIDAALVVLGADPPISADELALVEEVAAQVDVLVFALTKADRLGDAERAEARAFSEQVLARRLGRPVGPLYEVSGAERLTGSGPPRDWEALCERLRAVAGDASRERLVRGAEARGLRVLGGRLLREIDEALGALERPLEESERRIEALRRCVQEAERSLGDLRHLMMAERQRLHAALVEQQERFLARAVPAARAALGEELSQARGLGRGALRQRGIETAQVHFREALEQWRADEQPAAEARYRKAAERFVDLANEFLARVARAAEMDGLPRRIEGEVGFRVKSQLYYTEMLRLTGRSPLRWLVDALRPPGSARRAVAREVGAYLERLLVTNAARVKNDLDEQVERSRQRLEAEIRAHLRDVQAVAERALERARAQRARGEAAARAEIERLRALRARVEALRGAAGDG
ncbi:MAG TPA: dynamin family protein [Candidatus Binatia bacterium]|nr:dynamin family protein [Candidatus Binatia bacterium]